MSVAADTVGRLVSSPFCTKIAEIRSAVCAVDYDRIHLLFFFVCGLGVSALRGFGLLIRASAFRGLGLLFLLLMSLPSVSAV